MPENATRNVPTAAGSRDDRGKNFVVPSPKVPGNIDSFCLIPIPGFALPHLTALIDALPAG